MITTFANLPEKISDSIATILLQDDTWIKHAKQLHQRYMEKKKDLKKPYIQSLPDILAYLGMRVPATYAQIYGALLQTQQVLPTWKPESLLDLGSGPGTGVWAAQNIWPSLQSARCIDRSQHFISLGKDIFKNIATSLSIVLEQRDLANGIQNTHEKYDLIIIANVLNELAPIERKNLLTQVFKYCKGIMVVLEPGTPSGFQIIQTTAKNFSEKAKLIAPYVTNTFVQSNDYWIHFPQRFIRPEFQKRIRQNMRDDSFMPSDWEEAKYSYVAIGKIRQEKIWGRSVGPIKKEKGFIEVSILTENEIQKVKILKRNKEQYHFAKKLKWGEAIVHNLSFSS